VDFVVWTDITQGIEIAVEFEELVENNIYECWRME
jgi:hypothetical protein